MSSLLHHCSGAVIVSRRGREVREGAAARAAHTSARRPLLRRLGSSFAGSGGICTSESALLVRPFSPLFPTNPLLSPSPPQQPTPTHGFRAPPPDSILSKPRQPTRLHHMHAAITLPSRPGARSTVLPFPFSVRTTCSLDGSSAGWSRVCSLGGNREGRRSSCRCWLYMGR
jgi:hypothetical protein